MMKRSLLYIFAFLSMNFISLYPQPSGQQCNWREVENKARNAVIQVTAQSGDFNWHEPYKGLDQNEGAGSGFFINDAGYFFTNYHVVRNAKTVQVYVPALGRHPLNACSIGVCPELDVALYKIDDEGIKKIKKVLGKIDYVTLGDSDTLFETESVLAIGYQLGQRYSKTTLGCVAGREYSDGFSYMHITAAINPGSSGGPLFNSKGEVVGITSAGVPTAQNVGYIIPINDVKILLPQLKKTKLVRKPRLGVKHNPTTDEHAMLLKNPLPAGLYINNIIKNSSADKAGVCPGDMLYVINGYHVDQFGDVSVDWASSGKISLEEFLIRLPYNEQLELIVYRNGVKKKLTCIFQESPLRPIRWIYPDYESEAIDYEMIGGMCIMQLRANHLNLIEEKILPDTLQLQNYMNFDNQDQEVLIVTHILPGSYTHKINCLCDGTILDTVNDKKIKTLEDLRQALQDSVQSGYIRLTTQNKVSTVISLDTVCNDEERLARDFGFNITPFVKQLREKRQQVSQAKKISKKS